MNIRGLIFALLTVNLFILQACDNDDDIDKNSIFIGSGNHGEYDIWIVQLEPYGDLQWQKCLGGSHAEYATSLQLTDDGGYINAGDTESNDGDVAARTAE